MEELFSLAQPDAQEIEETLESNQSKLFNYNKVALFVLVSLFVFMGAFSASALTLDAYQKEVLSVQAKNSLQNHVLSAQDQNPQVLQASTGNSYYVASNGSDSSGDGSINNPWQTVTYAAGGAEGKVKPGDTIFVRGGTYRQVINMETFSGEPGKPITVTNYPGEEPVFTDQAGPMVKIKTSHVVVNGLTFRDYRGFGIRVQTEPNDGALQLRDIKITNNKLIRQLPNVSHPNSHDGLSVRAYGPGSLIEDVLIEGNYLKDIHTGLLQRDVGGPNEYIVRGSEALSIERDVRNLRILNNTIDTTSNIALNLVSRNDFTNNDEIIGPKNVIIKGNHILEGGHLPRDTDLEGTIKKSSAGIYMDGPKGNIIIEDNIVHEGIDGIKVSQEYAANKVNTQHVIVRRNVSYNADQHQFNIGTSANKNEESCVPISGITGRDVRGYMRNVAVVHNTSVLDKNNNGKAIKYSCGDAISIKNNIFVAVQDEDKFSSGYYAKYNNSSPKAWGKWDSDYNFVHFDLVANAIDWGTDHYDSLGEFTAATGWDKNSKELTKSEFNGLFKDFSGRNFELASGSVAVDAGGPLTTTRSAGSGRSVPVGNADYFTNGFGITGVPNDLVRIDGQGPYKVVAVNYGSNTLTLDQDASWGSNVAVNYDYAGNGPDVGAFESGYTAPNNTPPTTPPPGSPDPTPPPPTNTEDYDVKHAPATVFIDGDLSEFENANKFNISSSTNSGEFALLWDETYLYIGALVNDQSLYSQRTALDDDLWRDDSLEFVIDTLNNKSSSRDDDDYKFFVNLNNAHRDEQAHNKDWSTEYYSEVNYVGTLNDIEGIDSNYAMEVAIPWSSIGVNPAIGDVFGADLRLNAVSDDGVRNSADWFVFDTDQINNPKGWGAISLSADEASTTPPVGSSNVYEAEDANFGDFVGGGTSRVETTHSGYSGTGFVDMSDPYSGEGGFVDWMVNVAEQGDYDLLFRYALSGNIFINGGRPLDLFVNGQLVQEGLVFEQTGSWATWSNVVKRASLMEGNNNIQLVATESIGGPNIDYVALVPVTGSAPTPPSDPAPPEDPPVEVPHDENNLLLNPSFEDGSVEWWFYPEFAGTSKSNVRSGTRAAYINAETDEWYQFQQNVRGNVANRKFMLSGYIRPDLDDAGARLKLMFYKDSQQLEVHNTSYVRGTNGYSYVSVTATAPAEANMVKVKAETNSSGLGIAYFDDLSLVDITPQSSSDLPVGGTGNFSSNRTYTSPHIGSGNPCEEGKYLDLSADNPVCRDLLHSHGFDFAKFDAAVSDKVYELPKSECTNAGLQNLFDSVGSDGGTVVLPECEIVITRMLLVPGNIVLQGAGVDKTVIRRQGYANDLMRFKHKSNIIYRDFTADGGGTHGLIIANSFADNVLAERLLLKNSSKTGFNYRYSKNITVRYIEAHNLQHGIGSKDCFVKDGADNNGCHNESMRRSDTGGYEPGQLYSESYAHYSNVSHDNYGLGIDSHANVGEVAGNLIYNTDGTKFPDAHDVVVHHNKLHNNIGTYGTRTYKIYNVPNNVVWWKNQFINSVGSSERPIIRTGPETKNAYIIDNTYRNNKSNVAANAGELFACSGTEDIGLPTPGYNSIKTAPSAICEQYIEREGSPVLPPETTPPPPEENPAPIVNRPVNISGNPCNEDEYLDLSDGGNSCKNILNTDYGFDWDRFNAAHNPNNVQNLLESQCTDEGIRSLFAAVENQGGGVINLPACTITLNRRLHVPPNTIVQGRGAGQTKFIVHGDNYFYVGEDDESKPKKQNIIVRDIEIDGENIGGRLFRIYRMENVLVERVSTHHSLERNGFAYQGTDNLTLRYNTSYGHGRHGIEVSNDHPYDRSKNNLIYSNNVYDNGGLSIDAHTQFTEVAGNRFHGSEDGTKNITANDMIYHHNLFEAHEYAKHNPSNPDRILSRVLRSYQSEKDNFAIPNNLIFAENVFRNNKGRIGIIHAPTYDYYLINNTYENNYAGGEVQVKGDPGLYVCAGSEDANLNYVNNDGSPWNVKFVPEDSDLCVDDYLGEGSSNTPTPTPPPASTCGDTQCTGNETCFSCSADCGPCGNSGKTRYEAEEAQFGDNIGGGTTKFDTKHSGYSGEGYVNLTDTPLGKGSYVSWTLNVPQTGVYRATIGYAMGSRPRPMDLYINGAEMTRLRFAETANWNTHTELPTEVVLNEGINTYYITSVWTSGGPDIDYLDLEYIGPVTASTLPDDFDGHVISGKIEAEDYTDQKGIDTEKTTDSGGGRNIGWLHPGDWVEYRVYVMEGGTYDVQIRYASPDGKGRVKFIDKDGNVLGEFASSRTGGWQKWQTGTMRFDLEQGVNTIRLDVKTRKQNFNWFNFVHVPSTGATTTSPFAIEIDKTPIEKPPVDRVSAPESQEPEATLRGSGTPEESSTFVTPSSIGSAIFTDSFEDSPYEDFETQGRRTTFEWSDVARTGDKSISIVQNDARYGGDWLSDKGYIAIEGGKEYKLTVWMKGQNIGGSAKMTLSYYGGTVGLRYINRFEKQIPASSLNPGEWIPVEVVGVASADATYIKVDLGLQGLGTLWIDDLSVESL